MARYKISRGGNPTTLFDLASKKIKNGLEDKDWILVKSALLEMKIASQYAKEGQFLATHPDAAISIMKACLLDASISLAKEIQEAALQLLSELCEEGFSNRQVLNAYPEFYVVLLNCLTSPGNDHHDAVQALSNATALQPEGMPPSLSPYWAKIYNIMLSKVQNEKCIMAERAGALVTIANICAFAIKLQQKELEYFAKLAVEYIEKGIEEEFEGAFWNGLKFLALYHESHRVWIYNIPGMLDLAFKRSERAPSAARVECLSFISELACSPKNLEHMLTLPILFSSTLASAKRGEPDEIRECAMGIIINVTGTGNVPWFAAPPILDAAFDIVNDAKASVEVHSAGLMVIANICSKVPNFKIKQNEILDVTTRFLISSQSTEEMVKTCIKIIRGLTQYLENQTHVVKKTGLIDLVLKQVNSQQSETALLAVVALGQMAAFEETAHALAENPRLFPVLINSLRSTVRGGDFDGLVICTLVHFSKESSCLNEIKKHQQQLAPLVLQYCRSPSLQKYVKWSFQLLCRIAS